MKNDPLGVTQALKNRYGDLLHLRIWPEHIVQITDPTLVRELMVKHSDLIVRRKRMREVFAQVHGQSVITTEGAAWKAQRQTLQPLFSPREVHRDFEGTVQSVTQSLRQWPTQDTSDWPIQSRFSHLALSIILRTLFSVQGQSADEIARAARVEDALRLVSSVGNKAFFYPADLPDWMPWKWRFGRAKKYLDELVRGHIARRVAMNEADWPDDLLSQLLKVRDSNGQPWPVQALRDECMTLFLAGHETTAAALTWWVWCMAKHPQAQERAVREIHEVVGPDKTLTLEAISKLTWLAQTIQESMRLFPVTPFLIMRCADAPIALSDYSFAKGTCFQIPLMLMHRDERWYPQADLFKPERFAGTSAAPRGSYMPFGTGPRVCLGMHFAQTEILVTATKLLQQYQIAPSPTDAEPIPELNVILKPKVPLRVRLTPLRN